MAKRTLNYCRAVVVVHGLSEKIIAEEIKKCLRIPLEIYSKNGGRNSIQIGSLSAIFNSERTFKSSKKFLENYYNIEIVKGQPQNFKLFTVIDTDDCDAATLQKYQSNTLLSNHWLCPYIVPISNTPSLEHVFLDAGLIDHIFSDSEKRTGYQKMFTALSKEMNHPEIIKYLYDLTQRQRSSNVKTNISKFFQYCLEWSTEITIR